MAREHLEHFLPSLLDRLIDRFPNTGAVGAAPSQPRPPAEVSDPGQRGDGAEARIRPRTDDRGMYSHRQLRESVLADLEFLLNTGNLETVEDLKAYPFVARSSLNYGIPELSGWTASSVSPAALEMAVLTAIKRFEPRIFAETLKVRAILATDQMNKNTLGFEIQGLLWGTPVPSSMLIRTEVDLETGHVDIKEFSA